MALKPPPLKAPPHLLCDWIELRTIATPLGRYRLGSLKRAWDVNRESEDSDPEGFTGRETDTDVEGVSGADEDAFLDAVGRHDALHTVLAYADAPAAQFLPHPGPAVC